MFLTSASVYLQHNHNLPVGERMSEEKFEEEEEEEEQPSFSWFMPFETKLLQIFCCLHDQFDSRRGPAALFVSVD